MQFSIVPSLTEFIKPDFYIPSTVSLIDGGTLSTNWKHSDEYNSVMSLVHILSGI